MAGTKLKTQIQEAAADFRASTTNADVKVLPAQKSKKDLIPGHFYKTRFFAALSLFLAINFLFKFQYRVDRFDLPERSFIWWAVKEYRELQKAPDILLFGSSLMLAAVNEGDATHYKKLVDTAKHHSSIYLQYLLNKTYGRDVSNYCFAIGGQMASDVYAIAANFVDNNRKPRLIVWGIAPRDLVDAAFPGAATSDTAHYMNKIAGKALIAEDRRTFNSVIDQFLQKVLYIYKIRESILSNLKQVGRAYEANITQWVSAITHKKTEDSIFPPGRQKMLRELMNPRDGNMGDIEIGEWLIGPNGAPSITLKDNTHEYLARYNPFKLKTFASQRAYLEKFLQQQKELGVKVLLVNMPLTVVNMSLLPPETYETYIYTVKLLAQKYGAEVLDLNGDARFPQSYFFDTAHLNGLGAERFIEVLSTDKRLVEPDKIGSVSQGKVPN